MPPFLESQHARVTPSHNTGPNLTLPLSLPSLSSFLLPLIHSLTPAPSIKEFPSDSDVVDGEEVVFNVRVTGYPRPSFTWYQNGTKMTTDHSFTLGEDGSLVIHTAEMGHAGVYELEVANELGVDRRRVSLGVYGSEIELPGDYQMTVPAVPLAKFGPYVAKSHEKSNTGFNNQYRVSVNGYHHGSNPFMSFISLWSLLPNVLQRWL